MKIAWLTAARDSLRAQIAFIAHENPAAPYSDQEIRAIFFALLHGLQHQAS